MSGSEHGDARLELAELTRALRAHLEVLAASGAWGLPRGAPRPVATEASSDVTAVQPTGAFTPPGPDPSVGKTFGTNAEPAARAQAPDAAITRGAAPTSAFAHAPRAGFAPTPSDATPNRDDEVGEMASQIDTGAETSRPSAPPPPAASRPAPALPGRAPTVASGPVPPRPGAALPPPAPAVAAASAASSAALGRTAPLDEATRRLRLVTLAEEIRTCQRCTLHSGRTQTVFARGDGSSGVCFIGEGPGQDEDEQGFPFVGKAGQLLDRMIQAMGLGRDEVYVCNIVKCRPPNNRKPTPEEMQACLPYLAEQVELIDPKVIVALGSTAVQGLFGTSEGIMRLRGRWKLYKGRIAVMPTYHPAYLLRTPSAKRDVWEDLQAVLKQLGRSVPARQ